MCNYSDLIEERGIEKGRLEGRLEGLLEGRLEGHLEGLLEGRLEGHLEGLLEGRVSLIRKKLAKGKSLEQIADDLEETVESIRPLYEQVLMEMN